jgi:hypothetical protein
MQIVLKNQINIFRPMKTKSLAAARSSFIQYIPKYLSLCQSQIIGDFQKVQLKQFGIGHV